MVYYNKKRKSYKPYAKKGVSKAAVKTMITKATDWSYYIVNEYQTGPIENYYVQPLTNPSWTETGKTVLKQLKLNVFRKASGLTRVIVFQSVDKFASSYSATPPQCAIDIITDTSNDEKSAIAQLYPDQKKHKILMDKIFYQDTTANPNRIVQRTFNKLSPLTLSNNAATPEGHIYVLVVTQAIGGDGDIHISSTVKYSS